LALVLLDKAKRYIVYEVIVHIPNGSIRTAKAKQPLLGAALRAIEGR
jgi:hypothetical protein